MSPFTNQDNETIIRNLKAEVAHLTGKLAEAQKEDELRKRAVGHIRAVVDEAIALTERMKNSLSATDPVTTKRRAEVVALGAYFKQCNSDFSAVMAGFPVAEKAERPKLEDDNRDNPSKGKK